MNEIQKSKTETISCDKSEIENDDIGKVPYSSLRYFKKL